MAELYRKKVTDSVEVNELTKENILAVALWCGGQQVEEKDPHEEGVTYVALNIPTLRGVQRASEGDFILKSKGGDFIVNKPREFHAGYEKVD